MFVGYVWAIFLNFVGLFSRDENFVVGFFSRAEKFVIFYQGLWAEKTSAFFIFYYYIYSRAF